MTGIATYQPLEHVLLRYADDPALLHWRGVISPITSLEDPAHLRERYLVITPDRDVYIWNALERARYPYVRRWDRGFQSLPHQNRQEVVLDVDEPGGRFTRRL